MKRQRSENWLEEDKFILKELVKERVATLENKNTDANTNAKKVAAWHDLHTNFNSMAKTSRTLQQIKVQWSIIKMSEKKRKFLERKDRFQTGGGPPPASEPPSGDDIAVWLPHAFTVDLNQFDSDNQNCLEINSDYEEKQHDQQNEKKEPCPCDVIIKQNNMPEIILEESTSKQKSDFCTEPKIPISKSKKKKISNTKKESAALQIAETEIACRKELHEAQMANEHQKLKNLLLMEDVFKHKLNYYKNKLN